MSDQEDRSAFDGVRDAILQSDRDAAQAEAYYRVLRASKRLQDVLLLEVRCAHRCLLLHVFETPAGNAFHLPRHRLSPNRNANSSNADGRRVNTEDGNRRWKSRTSLLRWAMNLSLSCDHLQTVIELNDDDLGTPGSPKRRRL